MAKRIELVAQLQPRLIDEDIAAAYHGIIERNFRQGWLSSEMPQPQKIGQRLLRDLWLLDPYVDTLSGIDPRQPPELVSWSDL